MTTTRTAKQQRGEPDEVYTRPNDDPAVEGMRSPPPSQPTAPDPNHDISDNAEVRDNPTPVERHETVENRALPCQMIWRYKQPNAQRPPVERYIREHKHVE